MLVFFAQNSSQDHSCFGHNLNFADEEHIVLRHILCDKQIQKYFNFKLKTGLRTAFAIPKSETFKDAALTESSAADDLEEPFAFKQQVSPIFDILFDRVKALNP